MDIAIVHVLQAVKHGVPSIVDAFMIDFQLAAVLMNRVGIDDNSSRRNIDRADLRRLLLIVSDLNCTITKEQDAQRALLMKQGKMLYAQPHFVRQEIGVVFPAIGKSSRTIL